MATTIPNAVDRETWAVRIEFARQDDNSTTDISVEAGRVIAWREQPEAGPDDGPWYAPVVIPVVTYYHGAGQPMFGFSAGAYPWVRGRRKADGELWLTIVFTGSDLDALLLDQVYPDNWLPGSSVPEAVQRVQEFIQGLGYPL